MRFDCTGAYGLHVNPGPGAPEAPRNYSKKQMDSMNLLFLGKIGKLTKHDPPKASKRVRGYRANVPWAPLGAPLVPRSVFEDEKWTQRAPKVPTELKITQKRNTEEPQKIEKLLQTCSIFRTWPGGLREALTIKTWDRMFFYLFGLERLPLL